MRIVRTRDMLADREDSHVELDRGMSCLIRVNFGPLRLINIGSNTGVTQRVRYGTRRL
jgi:hypothetical protein